MSQYQDDTLFARDEIIAARALLPGVEIPQPVAAAGAEIIQRMRVDSLRAEMTLLEAARAYAAADARPQVTFWRI